LVEREFMPPHMLTLYKWMAEYYFSPLGEVLKLALPSKILKKYETPAKRALEPAKVCAPRPNFHQSAAIKSIVDALKKQSYAAFLLHGITGSGKTEVYLRCVDHVIRSGGRALVLVPEIAQTPLLFERFEERFRGQVATIHSTLTDKERRQVWYAIKSGEYRVVIGPRSTVFIPIPELKIVIVDEEHDPSYKEHTRMPHYNARDVAVARSKFEDCVVVLGSATPQVESFHNTEIGKYRLLDLKERIDARPLPEIEIIDLRHETRPFISPPMERQITQTLQKGEQIIVFLNRRGFAPSLLCPYCGFTARCPFCKLPLVYHKAEPDEAAGLSCHVCTHRSPVRSTCPKCGRATLLYRGAGTQRIEELLNRIVESVDVGAKAKASVVVRLDRDSARPRGSMETILSTFQQGAAKILLGTQLVTKGFDFHDVTLVCIINADTILHLPDFRSGERTFQVLTQVAGRSGRGEKPGKVLIQTYHPEQYAAIFGQLQDYGTFYRNELQSREELGFPPFSKLVLIRFRGTIEQDVWSEARKLHQVLQQKGGFEVYGPNESFYYKIRDNYRVFILLKLKRAESQRKLDFLRVYRPAKCEMEIDVDPLEVF
ncbi:primosomal protein N', partial [candidate division WOR-3 bacterium]|nr:primosomal protein N' [candidate division WOR-3 bacterium]